MTSLVKFTDMIAHIQSLKLFQVAATRGLRAEDTQRLWSSVNVALGRAVFLHRTGSTEWYEERKFWPSELGRVTLPLRIAVGKVQVR